MTGLWNKFWQQRAIYKFIEVAPPLLFLVLSVLHFYYGGFNEPWSPNISDWGATGDFFGGLLNPFIAYLMVIGVLLTLGQQEKAERTIENKKENDRRALEESNLKERKYRRTMSFIEEFHSRQFIEHRIAIWYYKEDIIGEKGSREIDQESPSKTTKLIYFDQEEKQYIKPTHMWEIVLGYVFPIAPGFAELVEEGDIFKGLSCHEHLTLYLGYYQRLGLAISNEFADLEMLKKSIAYSFRWNADFMLAFIQCTRDLVALRNENLRLGDAAVVLPDYVKHVENVYTALLPQDFIDSVVQNGRVSEIYRRTGFTGMPCFTEDRP